MLLPVATLRREKAFNDRQHALRYVGFAVHHSAIDMARATQRRQKLIRPVLAFADGAEEVF